MGYTKNYLLELLCLCSDEQFGQDAVEWAIMTGLVKLTYNQHQDLLTIMGRPGYPESGAYPAIVDASSSTCATRTRDAWKQTSPSWTP